MHKHPGRVTEVRESHDGKHVTVEIAHGKRKRDKDPKGQPVGDLHGYSRARSSITIPKKHAGNYAVGDRVHAGIALADDEESESEPDDEMAEAPAPATKRPPFMAKAKHGTADVATSSPIKAAMKRRLG